MANLAAARQQAIVAKLELLSEEKLEEVEDFVEFLCQRTDDRALVRGAALASQPVLNQIWDNEEDSVYDDL